MLQSYESSLDLEWTISTWKREWVIPTSIRIDPRLYYETSEFVKDVCLFDPQSYKTLFIYIIGIEPLKAQHYATKIDLTIFLLSLWCIDIDFSI